MDLNKMVNDNLAKIEQGNIVKDLVDERIKKTLRGIIEESLGTYSKFGKELTTQIGEQLQINLENLDIPRYNVLVRNAIKLKMDEIVTVNGIEKMIFQAYANGAKIIIDEENIDITYNDEDDY